MMARIAFVFRRGEDVRVRKGKASIEARWILSLADEWNGTRRLVNVPHEVSIRFWQREDCVKESLSDHNPENRRTETCGPSRFRLRPQILLPFAGDCID